MAIVMTSSDPSKFLEILFGSAPEIPEFTLDHEEALFNVPDLEFFSATQLSATRVALGSTNAWGSYEIVLTGDGLAPVDSLDALRNAIDQGLASGAFSQLMISGPVTMGGVSAPLLTLDATPTGYTLTSGNQSLVVTGSLPQTLDEVGDITRAFELLSRYDTLTATEKTQVQSLLSGASISGLDLHDNGESFSNLNLSASKVSLGFADYQVTLDGTFPTDLGAVFDVLNQIETLMLAPEGLTSLAQIPALALDAMRVTGTDGEILLELTGPVTDEASLEQSDLTIGGVPVVRGGVQLLEVWFGDSGESSPFFGSGYSDFQSFFDDDMNPATPPFGAIYFGLAGDDVLDGGAGQDYLYGGSGSDTLQGNGGDDILTGGPGADDFSLGVSPWLTQTVGTHRITDFEIGIDRLSVFDINATDVEIARSFARATDTDDGALVSFADGSGVILEGLTAAQATTLSPVTFTPSQADDVLFGTANSNIIDGLGGNDLIEAGDGADTVVGGEGNDTILGGASEADLRDVVYAGAGDDSVDGGHGNDQLYGMGGNDTLEGGFGADRLIGGDGNDVLSGGAGSDLIFGGDGFDFINGGFGSDRLNGGAGADRFFHIGSAGHGSDWIQDYSAAEGDVLVYGGGPATARDFLVQIANTPGAGVAGVNEAFVTHIPSGNLLWALVDGDGQTSINIQLGGQVFDLLA